jgi:recombination protein RecA
VDILFGHGISREGDLIDFGAERGVVEKSGSWFSFEGERIGQGRDNARAFLVENAAIRDRIDTAIRATAGLLKPETAVAKQPEVPAARVAAKSA